jgi:hypothetical protein
LKHCSVNGIKFVLLKREFCCTHVCPRCSFIPAMQFIFFIYLHLWRTVKTVEDVSNYVVDLVSCHKVRRVMVHSRHAIFFSPLVGLGFLVVEVLRSHTHTHTHTLGRTPLDEWSGRRRDRYVTTHNTLQRHTSVPSGGIRTRTPSRRAAADPRLTPRGHWDRPACNSTNIKPSLPLMNTVCMRAVQFYFLKTESECITENIRKLFKLNCCHDFFQRCSSWYQQIMQPAKYAVHGSQINLLFNSYTSFFRIPMRKRHFIFTCSSH